MNTPGHTRSDYCACHDSFELTGFCARCYGLWGLSPRGRPWKHECPRCGGLRGTGSYPDLCGRCEPEVRKEIAEEQAEREAKKRAKQAGERARREKS